MLNFISDGSAFLAPPMLWLADFIALSFIYCLKRLKACFGPWWMRYLNPLAINPNLKLDSKKTSHIFSSLIGFVIRQLVEVCILTTSFFATSHCSFNCVSSSSTLSFFSSAFFTCSLKVKTTFISALLAFSWAAFSSSWLLRIELSFRICSSFPFIRSVKASIFSWLSASIFRTNTSYFPICSMAFSFLR